jgi:hypothetical protein
MRELLQRERDFHDRWAEAIDRRGHSGERFMRRFAWNIAVVATK